MSHVRATAVFNKDYKRLRKKYPQLAQEIGELISQLQQSVYQGVQIPGTGFTVFKVRLPNPDAERGKSGGFRVIYYLQTAEDVLLLAVYDKAERQDISPREIRRIINLYKSGEA